MYAMTTLKGSKKRKRKTNNEAAEPIPELSSDILLDILCRLPVKSVFRCGAVCRAWRAIVTDPFFTRAHLRCSASKCEQDPCLVITPHTLFAILPEEEGQWPITFSNHIRFYKWQQGATMATFMHAKDFGDEFMYVRRFFAHCDGLVLAPTDSKLYLFNPATRETFTLPDRERKYWKPGRDVRIHTVSAGLGLDPRTGNYKVVRVFYRSLHPYTRMGFDMDMEVFTVSGDGGGAWRKIKGFLRYNVAIWQTAVSVRGFLFWHLSPNSRHGLLHLSLADETFGTIKLPYDSADPNAFSLLNELHGELCVTQRTSEETVTIWTLPIQEYDGGQGHCSWEQRCIVRICGSFVRPLAFLPGGRIMLTSGFNVDIYDIATEELTTVCQMDRLKYQGRRARTWKNLFLFNVHRYTESLVRICV